ncbi:MAG: adenosylcobinamide-GDP ribazoletransferase [Chloroflexi bacterium HGW-Chloroflexi-10]|nr:MAG: adenosylcobinamide-GDP ribazoletransferase [Chloroflexi bacterium HGW-Chloroflexi-10]
MSSLRQAFCFLTILPIPYPQQLQFKDLGKSARWFPLVGLVIGLLLAGLRWVLGLIFPPLLVGILVVAAWALLTGGLHLDGLADCGDGLLVSAAPERRLEILKDSRLGSFGALTLIFHLLIKVATVSLLTTPIAWFALPAAAAMGRAMLVWSATRPFARPGGMGETFANGLAKPVQWLPWVILAVGLPMMGVGWLAIPAILLSILLTLAIQRMAARRLGGLTGDVLGLVVELVETAVLLIMVIQ